MHQLRIRPAFRAALAAACFAGPIGAAAGQDTSDSIARALHLRQGAYQVFDLPAAALEVGAWHLEIPLEGEQLELTLHAHSLRSPAFELIVADDSGLHPASDVPAPRTTRGQAWDASGLPRGPVAGSTNTGGQWTLLLALDQGTFQVQPLTEVDAAADPRLHVLYAARDVLPGPWQCGTEGLGDGSDFGSGGAPRHDGVTQQVEVAFDADYPFFQQNGSSKDATLQDIEAVLSGLSLIYERDTGISYEITAVVVRTTSGADPYNTSKPGLLLDQFQRNWNERKPYIWRDTAHLMTGRNTGGTIGVANIGVICNLPYAYGLSQSRFTSNMTLRIALTAHELGHNWSAVHCDAAECYIMCSFIGGCGPNDRFGPRSFDRITQHRDSRTCLEERHAHAPVPFYDGFAALDFDREVWSYHPRAEISDEAGGEPSIEYAVKLNAEGDKAHQDDDVRTNDLDLTGESDLYLTFFSLHRGVPAGRELQVEYYAADRLWKDLHAVVSSGVDQSAFQFQRVALPPATYWHGFRLRLRPQSDSLTETWFVDDVQVRRGGVAHVVSPLVPGAPVTFAALGLDPGDLAVFFYSLAGLGSGPCIEDACLDLLVPIFLLGIAPAGGEGIATFAASVPPGTPPVDVFSQVIATDGVDFHSSHPASSAVK